MQMYILLLSLFIIQLEGSIVPMSWTVNEEERTALVYMPKKTLSEKSPLVFVWHGHRGSSEKFLKKCSVHKFWPEAIVVYPQGLNTRTPYDRNGKHTGWQHSIGDSSDRDVAFFDAMYNHFSELNLIDLKRVHSAGSSNGGAFTYVLLQMRPNIFASVAPAITNHIGIEDDQPIDLPPVPILHFTGEREPTFSKQKQLIEKIIESRDAKLADNWQGHPGVNLYKSSEGNLIWFVHSKGHRWRYVDTRPMVKFFKNHSKQ
jgi:polyhydroxybutyrate depolymerase